MAVAQRRRLWATRVVDLRTARMEESTGGNRAGPRPQAARGERHLLTRPRPDAQSAVGRPCLRPPSQGHDRHGPLDDCSTRCSRPAAPPSEMVAGMHLSLHTSSARCGAHRGEAARPCADKVRLRQVYLEPAGRDVGDRCGLRRRLRLVDGFSSAFRRSLRMRPSDLRPRRAGHWLRPQPGSTLPLAHRPVHRRRARTQGTGRRSGTC